MINIPRVLDARLREVDALHGKQLCLAYAEHTLRQCADALTPEQLDLSLGYLEAARDLFNGEGMTALADLHRAYFKIRLAGSRQAEEITWVAVIAVSACWQRELKAEGLVQDQLVDTNVLAVSQDSQRVVGMCGGSSLAEARWQLIHLLETAPVFDLGSLSHLFTGVDETQAKLLALDYAEHAGGSVPISSTVDLAAVARRAQLLVLTRHRDETARWNEERWQLIHLLETIQDSQPERRFPSK